MCGNNDRWNIVDEHKKIDVEVDINTNAKKLSLF
jgi:hypothetical protein